MPVTYKFEPLNVDVLLATSGPDASQALADFAAEQIDLAEAQNTEALGQPPSYSTFVDGVQGAALNRVKPDGTIVTVFDLASDMLQHILDLLIVAAPYLTGAFKKSITVYADGEEVEDVSEATGASEVVFLATVPYARKIERGLSRQAPDGVFEAVAAIVAARYGNQAQIRFGFREPMGGATALAEWASKRSAGRTRRQRAGDVRQPAIVVTFR